MSLLHDLYIYGKRKGFDKHSVLLQEVKIDWYIDLKSNGSFSLTSADAKHLLKTYGTRTSSRTLSNPRVNTLWDAFEWYSSKSPKEYEGLFWDRAVEVLSGAGEKQLVKVINKARCSVFISDIQNELKGNFALRYNGELLFHKDSVLEYLDNEVDNGPKATCLITGKECVPVRLHPEVSIPGFLHTSSPTIAFNADVFNTGKLKQGDNFPVSGNATNSYSLAFAELAQQAIRIKSGSSNRVAVIVWSDEDTPNTQKIRTILGGKEPDWNFEKPSGNIHFLAVSVEKKRRPIIAYDVLPEEVVLENLKIFRQGSFGLFEQKSIRDQVTSIELAIHRERVGREFPPEMIVNLFRHALFGTPVSRTIQKKMIKLFTKRVSQKDGLRLGWLSQLYIKWVEFFLFSQRRYA